MASYFRRAWLRAAFLVLMALSWDQSQRLQLPHARGLLPTTPPTPFIQYAAQSEKRGQILVVHGLDSSKEFMQFFSSALAEGGFDVYAIDLPGHGDSAAGFDANAAEMIIKTTLTNLGNDTIVIGHSLGAGLLLDLATGQRFETMVLLSPPPTPVSRLEVGRLLVVTGDWDMPRINAFIPTLKEVASPGLEWWRLPWAAHSSAVFNASQIAAIVQWLGGATDQLQTRSRVTWLGILLGSSAALGITLIPGSAIMPRRGSFKNALLLYAAAGGATLVVLKFVVVMAWIRLFATDYLISFLLVSGILLWLMQSTFTRARSQTAPIAKPSIIAGTGPDRAGAKVRSCFLGVLPAAYVIVIGLLGGSYMLHFTLSDGRWWRFPFIAAAALPLFMMDELMLRPIYPRWKAAALGLITRLLLGAFITTGVLLFSPQHAFIVLVIHLIVLFWMLLWFATELVHRYTQSPAGAALFAALIQGWAFAALFVTI